MPYRWGQGHTLGARLVSSGINESSKFVPVLPSVPVSVPVPVPVPAPVPAPATVIVPVLLFVLVAAPLPKEAY